MLPLTRCIARRGCVFSSCPEQRVISVPKKLRIEIVSIVELFIPSRAKICVNHLKNGDWHNLKTSGILLYSPEMASEAMSLLKMAGNVKKTQTHDIGLTTEQFRELSQQLFRFRNRYQKLADSALETYLRYLRTGFTNNELAEEYKVSTGTIQNRIRIARNALLEEFVPVSLGIINFFVVVFRFNLFWLQDLLQWIENSLRKMPVPSLKSCLIYRLIKL